MLLFNRTSRIQEVFIFRWPCIPLQILANNQLDALFHVFIYFISVHVSSVTVLIIRRSLTQTNRTRWCINTIRSPDDEHCDVRNMYRDEINKNMKKCVNLVISKNPRGDKIDYLSTDKMCWCNWCNSLSVLLCVTVWWCETFIDLPSLITVENVCVSHSLSPLEHSVRISILCCDSVVIIEYMYILCAVRQSNLTAPQIHEF